VLVTGCPAPDNPQAPFRGPGNRPNQIDRRRAYDLTVTTLADVTEIAGQDGYLAVVSTLRFDGTIQASVVNAGVLAHPVDGTDVVAFATYGKTKLANLRVRPQVTVTFRAGWKWVAVEGRAELIGPGDTASGFDAEAIRVLLREVFTAAGGTHDDWDAYDRTMVEQRRAVVLVRPLRAYSN
jgi:PPOX class probable F420-dependent enzyme